MGLAASSREYQEMRASSVSSKRKRWGKAEQHSLPQGFHLHWILPLTTDSGPFTGIGRPGSRRGRRQTLSAPGGSERGVGMTASKSCPPGPTGRAARSPGRGLALPPLQSSGGSLHSRGSGEGVGGACAHDPGQALQSAAAPGRLLPNSRRARVVLATAAPRRSSSFLPRLGVVCVRVCVCVCVRARVCAWVATHSQVCCVILHTQARPDVCAHQGPRHMHDKCWGDPGPLAPVGRTPGSWVRPDGEGQLQAWAHP